MFKKRLTLFLLVFATVFAGRSFATTEPVEAKETKLESDSTTVTAKNNQLLNSSQERPTVKSNASDNDSSFAFWQTEEEVEEDSTSNSALSFNFIYYIIEKFKFQVE